MRWHSRILAVLVFGLVLVGGHPAAVAQDPREMLVSLVQLIANPTGFDQRRVLIKGYVVLEVENKAIYLTEGDAKHSVTRNSLWLDINVNDPLFANRSRYHRRYVLVEGTFNARRRGHLDLSSGVIEHIRRFDID